MTCESVLVGTAMIDIKISEQWTTEPPDHQLKNSGGLGNLSLTNHTTLPHGNLIKCSDLKLHVCEH